jgi:hypothetical protein
MVGKWIDDVISGQGRILQICEQIAKVGFVFVLSISPRIADILP